MNSISRALNKVGRGVKSVGKGIGKALQKHFIDPSMKVGKIRDEKMQEMSRKAKSGEFNY